MVEDRDVRQATRRTHALVLAGGRGSRLRMLTDRRAKPAVYFGGKFRIVDFALSNCVNSGIRRISVLTQYKSHSLLRHLQRGWNFLRGEMNEFVDLLPAQQRIDETSWYQGTADAVYQNLDILRSHGSEFVVILAGDHIYKMDYGGMLRDHIAKGADCTVACLEVPRMQATGFGVMAIDADGRVTSFLEKPADPPGMPGRPDMALASMGVYVFDANFLYSQLERDAADPASSRDFGRDLIPHLVPRAKVIAHSFRDSCIYSRDGADAYWRDVGTVDAYHAANMDLIEVDPQLNLYDSRWPIRTHHPTYPPPKFVFAEDGPAARRGEATDSLVCPGAIVSGGRVTRSIIGPGVRVNSFARIEESILFEGVDIGRHARVRRAILDKGVRVPPGMSIGFDPDEDAARGLTVSPQGVTVVAKGHDLAAGQFAPSAP
jgi:glucose-1-phosphate adenylyltransferase